MGHHHDPERATTNHEMCEALSRQPGLIEVRSKGATRIFKGPKGVLTISDRPQQLDFHGRRRILRLARAAGIIMLALIIPAVFVLLH